MNYEPREGVDYLVDLYQVAAVPQDADAEIIKQSLNARAREYYPDRLQGLAPEFKDKGERMARLLNRARAVLLDTDRRREYDDILTTWKGPVSSDGTPVIRLDDALRAEMALRTPEEIESIFSAQAEQIADMVKHNPRQQALLRRLLDAAEGQDVEDIRDAYEASLFAEDQVLAIEESERGRLIGLPENRRYESSIGHAEKVRLSIGNARTAQAEEHRRRMLGGVGARLALMAGEDGPATTDQLDSRETGSLPHYFEAQAEQVAELAVRREKLLRKRLDIFQPTYPVAERQTDAHANFVIGITNQKDNDRYTWFGFNFDVETATLANTDIPDVVRQQLDSDAFAQVYAGGFNILTFSIRDQIELTSLLEEAYNKHLNKYFPGVLD